MKIQHSPHHWIAVALVVSALTLTLSEVHGQTTTTNTGVAAVTDSGIKPPGDNVKPAREPGVAKDQRSSVKKIKRAAKRTATRTRHGVSEIDTGSSPATAR